MIIDASDLYHEHLNTKTKTKTVSVLFPISSLSYSGFFTRLHPRYYGTARRAVCVCVCVVVCVCVASDIVLLHRDGSAAEIVVLK